MMHHTLAHLRSLKLEGLAGALEEQLIQPGLAPELRGTAHDAGGPRGPPATSASCAPVEERAAQIWTGRWKISTAGPAGASTIADHQPGPGRLGRYRPLLVAGPTGVGKSWLACALAQYACRRGHSALITRARLPKSCASAMAAGLRQMAASNGQNRSIVLDDWGMAPSTASPATTCLKSSTTGQHAPPSSQHNYPSSTGMRGSGTPPSLMPFSTG